MPHPDSVMEPSDLISKLFHPELLMPRIFQPGVITSALAGMARGYAGPTDSRRLVHALHCLLAGFGTKAWFDYVPSKANVSDEPSRVPELADADFVIAVDEDQDPTDLERALFLWMANADPTRDLLRRGRRIGFDARTKVPGRDDRDGVPVRDYPPMVSMSPEIVAKVDRRWNEYGFTGDVPPSRFGGDPGSVKQ